MMKREKRQDRFLLLIKTALVIGWCFVVTSAYGQERLISGTVTDNDNGDPVPGVSIVIEGSSSGTITDVNGKYTINVAGSDAVLRFSFIGFAAQSIEVGNQKTINVKLTPEVTGLDEVVVVGYGTMKKRDLTGAVASVKGTSIEKGEPTSFQSALAGRVAGVQVTQVDNGPGAGMNILIRGGSSLTSGNQPLFVIDGFPIIPGDDPSSNPLADLDPSEIESMEILKDASATAIYGAQGSNGVIIITTKMGTEGKPEININASYGLSRLAGYPDIFSQEEFPSFMIQNKNLYKYSSPDQMYSSVAYWQDIIDSGVQGKDWIEEITRMAHTKDASISFSGGDKGMRYAISGGYLNQEGIIIGSGFNRMNLNANLEQQIGRRIKVGTSIKVSMSKNTGMNDSWDENAIIKKALQSNPYISDDFSYIDYDATEETYQWNNENIINYLNRVENEYEASRLIGNMFFEYEILKNLKFYTSYGFNRDYKNGHKFLSKETRVGFPIGGRAEFAKDDNKNYVYQARLNYNKRIKKHSVNTTLVFETREDEYLDFRSKVEGFDDDSRGVYDLSSAATPFLPSNDYSDAAMMSYLGRLGYTYAGKYMLTASLRADGSSKFGSGNKWGYFPSAALGWLASEEQFIKDMNVFDMLKFRLSYGVTGNNQIPPYRALSQLQTQKYVFNDALYAGMVPGRIPNPDLKWESTEQYNAGIDLGFFKNRLLITAEAYYKKTTDLLLDVDLPSTSGFDKALKNIGAISNQGLELAINTVNVERKDFQWISSFTISTNKSKVLDLGEKQEMFFTRKFTNNVENDVLVRVGEPIGIYYGYIEDEVLNSANEIANSPEMKVLENIVGQVKLYDVNGDGVVNQMDKVPLARTAPDFVGGLNNEINYKNFDLSFFLRWSYGNDIVNGNVTYLDHVGDGNWNTLHSYADYAYSPLNPEGTVHGFVLSTYSNLMRSGYIEDGSYLKCDYITLGYTCPKSLLKRIGFNKLRIYGRVNNPFMLTRYSWFDPEVSTGWGTVAKVGPGADVGTYPRSVTYTLGLSIGL